MSREIVWSDATKLAELIRTKEISPVEVVEAFLDRIGQVNPQINAIVIGVKDVLAQARNAEKSVLDGVPLGPLHGVPFTIKDCIDTTGIKTTRGSLLFKERVPDRDGTVVTRLKNAGGIMIGKTNLPEFALDVDTSNRIFGTTNNPWDLQRSAGGSSGGEGASIAAGMSPLGIGSDVGGSIRIPAAFNGIVGLKASHGRIPLTGHWPEVLLTSMHVGPMARSVRDIALTLPLIAGPDGIDPYAAIVNLPSKLDLNGPLDGVRVAWSHEAGFAPVDKEIQQAVAAAASHLAKLGAEVEQVGLEFMARHDYVEDHIHIFNFEAVPAIQKVSGGNFDELASSTMWFVRTGSPTRDRYLEARAHMAKLKQQTGKFFRDYDALLIPSVPMPAFPHSNYQSLSGSALIVDGRSVEKVHVTKTTSPWDYTGSPALSVPFSWNADDLPLSVQVVGRRFDEATVLRIGSAIETGSIDSKRSPRL